MDSPHPLPLKLSRLKTSAIWPRRGTSGSACYDLATPFHGYLKPGVVTLVHTGWGMEVPEGHVMLLFNRSGNAKKGILLANGVGVIDSDYRGEIMVPLTLGYDPKYRRDNHYLIEPGDRIAQFLILPVPQLELLSTGELSETERADGGFGSTGS